MSELYKGIKWQDLTDEQMDEIGKNNDKILKKMKLPKKTEYKWKGRHIDSLTPEETKVALKEFMEVAHFEWQRNDEKHQENRKLWTEILNRTIGEPKA